MKPNSETRIDEELLIRLYYHYYFVMIKTYANSGEKSVFKFHEDTGRQLCLMIQHGYLSLEELYSLFYSMVYLDKHPSRLSTKLQIINKEYHSQCLKTFYTIKVGSKDLQSYKTTARLYLD